MAEATTHRKRDVTRYLLETETCQEGATNFHNNEKTWELLCVDLSNNKKTLKESELVKKLIFEASNRICDNLKDSEMNINLGDNRIIISFDEPCHPDKIAKTVAAIEEVFIKPFIIQGKRYIISTNTSSENISFAEANEPTAEVVIQARIITNIITSAIESYDLRLNYQPKIDLRNGKILGLEALVRWVHPIFGLLDAKDFIPMTEKNGQIVMIGEWVIREACRQNKEWQDHGLKIVPISVNISAKQFEQNNVYEMIASILLETNLAPEYLEIEITESAVVNEIEGVILQLRKLKHIGVSIIVDDFDVAYSSLNYMTRIPVDAVKINKLFIDGIGGNPKDEIILKTTISLVHQLGLTPVAEGVETKRQIEFLSKEKCFIIQGFYFFKPLLPDEAQLLINTSRNIGVVGTIPAKLMPEAKITRADIAKYLDGAGIKHSSMGYRYLTRAIQIGIEDVRMLSRIQKIYGVIAEEYSTNPNCVERSMRYVVTPCRKTCKEFVSEAVDRIIYY